MAPLDEEARRLVGAPPPGGSVVTTGSPRAAVDMVFVLIMALRLVRRLELRYGGRPGTLGLLKLMRQTISHLARTGGMAASDSLIQQVIGHGLAGKLSARFGEGVLNGLLMARRGLAAIEKTPGRCRLQRCAGPPSTVSPACYCAPRRLAGRKKCCLTNADQLSRLAANLQR
jgi:putative membrane protein